jgi:hypothetical protein
LLLVSECGRASVLFRSSNEAMRSGDVDIYSCYVSWTFIIHPTLKHLPHVYFTPCSAPDAVLPPTHQAGQGSFKLSAIHVCLAGILACWAYWAKKLAALVCSGRATKSCIAPIFTQMKCLGRKPSQWLSVGVERSAYLAARDRCARRGTQPSDKARGSVC